jgi:hypothetical protein
MDGERSFFAVLPLLETKMRNGHEHILTKKTLKPLSSRARRALPQSGFSYRAHPPRHGFRRQHGCRFGRGAVSVLLPRAPFF